MKSYGGHAELDDWASREARRSRKRHEESDWKKQVQEELEEMTDDIIYIIVNEFVPSNTDLAMREDVSFWRTGNAAWEELRSIAAEVGVDLDADKEEFYAPPMRGIEEDFYYIEERSFSG